MKNLFVILLVFIFAVVAFGNPSELEKIVESYKTEKNFNGVVLVATEGKIDFISGVGQADR
jgi:teichoic acid D-alanine hydrolase